MPAWDLLKGLSGAQLDVLRGVFEASDAGLEREDFVEALVRFSPRPAGYLRSLFRTIDYAGTQRVTWDAFTTFAIDSHMHATAQRPAEWIPPYTCKHSLDAQDTVVKVAHLSHWGGDGRIAVFSRGPKPLKLYNTRTMELIKAAGSEQMGGNGTVLCAEYHPGIQMLIACSTDGIMRMLDKELHLRYDLRLASLHLKLEYSTRFDALFAATRDGALVSYEMHRSYDMSGRPSIAKTTTYPLHDVQRPLTDFQFHPHHPTRLFTCSLDGNVKAVDLAGRGDAAQVIGKHDNGALAVSYSPDYNYVCSVGYEPEAYCWVNMAQARDQHMVLSDTSTPHRDTLVGVHAVPGTAEVITADQRGYVKVWDLRTFKCVQTFLMGWSPDEAYPPPVTRATMCYAPKTRQLLTSGVGRVCSHEQEVHARLREESVSIVLYNATQRAFVTAAGRGVKLWEAAQGCLTAHHKDASPADITALALDEHGRRLYVGANDGSLSCRVFATCECLYTFADAAKHAAEVCFIAYMPGKRAMYSAATDGAVLLHLDREEGRSCVKVQPPREEQPAPTHLAVAPGLQLLAVGGGQRVSLRDVSNSKDTISEIKLPEGTALTSMAFLEEKAALALAMENGRLLIFSVRPLGYVTASGVVDMAPFVLARWANVHPIHAELWACRQEAAQLAADREAAAAEFLGFSKKDEDAEDDPFETLLRTPLRAPHPVDRGAYYNSQHAFPSCGVLAYDAASHVLWTGDTSGVLTAWQLCSVYQHHGLHDITYPLKLDYVTGQVPVYAHLKHRPPCHDLDDGVPILRSFCAHADEVRYLAVHPDSGVLASSADDQRVLLWDCTGVLLCELSYQRAYPTYGVVTVPSPPEPWRPELNHCPAYAIHACSTRAACLADFVDADAPSGDPVVLLKLLHRLDWAWHGHPDADPPPHLRLSSAVDARRRYPIGSPALGPTSPISTVAAGTSPPHHPEPASTPGSARGTPLPPPEAAGPQVSQSPVCGHPLVAVADHVPTPQAVAALPEPARAAAVAAHPFAAPVQGDADTALPPTPRKRPAAGPGIGKGVSPLSSPAGGVPADAWGSGGKDAAALAAVYDRYERALQWYAVGGDYGGAAVMMGSAPVTPVSFLSPQTPAGMRGSPAPPSSTLAGMREALKQFVGSPAVTPQAPAPPASAMWRGEGGAWVTPDNHGGRAMAQRRGGGGGNKQRPPLAQGTPLRSGTPRAYPAREGAVSSFPATPTGRPPAGKRGRSRPPSIPTATPSPKLPPALEPSAMTAACSPMMRRRVPFGAGRGSVDAASAASSCTDADSPASRSMPGTPARGGVKAHSIASDSDMSVASPATKAQLLHFQGTSPPRVRGRVPASAVIRTSRPLSYKNQIDISRIRGGAGAAEAGGGALCTSSSESDEDEGWWSVGCEKKWSNRHGKVVTNEFLVQASPRGEALAPTALPFRAPKKAAKPAHLRHPPAAHAAPDALPVVSLSPADGALICIVGPDSDDEGAQPRQREEVEDVPAAATPRGGGRSRSPSVKCASPEAPSQRSLQLARRDDPLIHKVLLDEEAAALSPRAAPSQHGSFVISGPATPLEAAAVERSVSADSLEPCVAPPEAAMLRMAAAMVGVAAALTTVVHAAAALPPPRASRASRGKSRTRASVHLPCARSPPQSPLAGVVALAPPASPRGGGDAPPAADDAAGTAAMDPLAAPGGFGAEAAEGELPVKVSIPAKGPPLPAHELLKLSGRPAIRDQPRSPERERVLRQAAYGHRVRGRRMKGAKKAKALAAAAAVTRPGSTHHVADDVDDDEDTAPAALTPVVLDEGVADDTPPGAAARDGVSPTALRCAGGRGVAVQASEPRLHPVPSPPPWPLDEADRSVIRRRSEPLAPPPPFVRAPPRADERRLRSASSAAAHRVAARDTMWCKTLPSVAQMLQARRAPGSRRCPAAPASAQPDARRAAALTGTKVKTRHLLALSNGHVPLAARPATSRHTASLARQPAPPPPPPIDPDDIMQYFDANDKAHAEVIPVSP
eukprot:TRINITY_DN19685_c0_g1_i1.p1 TRINITY_DN19685_c0_g1~~TRINITY_DN19685_c0_g1_i1.p1  ORF type:complete len:2013 (+),score=638.18 TRINITY_DN19685_c0_g1_i1:182-6220(+)